MIDAYMPFADLHRWVGFQACDCRGPSAAMVGMPIQTRQNG